MQLVGQIVPEQRDEPDEILPDSGRKTLTTEILEGRMSFWIGRQDVVTESTADQPAART